MKGIGIVFRRFCFWCVICSFTWVVLSGIEIDFHLSLNKEKAVKAQKTLWDKTMKIVGRVGQVTKAFR